MKRPRLESYFPSASCVRLVTPVDSRFLITRSDPRTWSSILQDARIDGENAATEPQRWTASIAAEKNATNEKFTRAKPRADLRLSITVHAFARLFLCRKRCTMKKRRSDRASTMYARIAKRYDAVHSRLHSFSRLIRDPLAIFKRETSRVIPRETVDARSMHAALKQRTFPGRKPFRRLNRR